MIVVIFHRAPGMEPHDWTYDHYLKDGKTQASGRLTLPEGLMRSCNPWFWHIGWIFTIVECSRLFRIWRVTLAWAAQPELRLVMPLVISRIHQPGGCGQPGHRQGNTLITPIQVADFVAAVGNGGTLYKPSVIDRIMPVDGDPTYVFSPTVRGTLPVSAENLTIVQDAMVSVVMNPRGTALPHQFLRHQYLVSSTGISVAAKTGTAESGYGDPHAWFADTLSRGAKMRRILPLQCWWKMVVKARRSRAYLPACLGNLFPGSPQVRYPWEAQIGVVATPTPEVTNTPNPEGSETPAP